MANTRRNPYDEDVPPYTRLDTLRQMLGASSMRASQTPKPRWNPTRFPAYPPQNDHEPHHFGEDHSDDEDIAGIVDQGTEEKDDQWETSKIVDGGHDQMPDSIPKEDSGLGSAVWSLLHEYVPVPVPSRRRPRSIECLVMFTDGSLG